MVEAAPLVVLVETDLLLRRSYQRMARRLAIRLQAVGSAEEALELIAKDGPPALLISALGLPGIDGVSFLGRVKREHPRVRLVLSSGADPGPRLDSGIGLLPKPVEAIALARLVESLFAGESTLPPSPGR